MHFFSRYSYIWAFNSKKEKEYQEFNRSVNLISLQIINILIVIGMGLFILIDFFRQVNYTWVVTLRSTQLIIALSFILVARKQNLNSPQIDRFTFLTFVFQAIFALAIAFFGHMPSFFFTNITITILVFVTTISGLRFRHALYFNLAYLLAFIFYTQFFQRDAFYISQYANVFLMFLYSSIAGALIENRRRRAFLQYIDLARQKKRVDILNQQKNKIISVLSHDVASPIHSLAGLLHLHETDVVKAEELKPFMMDVRKRLDSVSTLVYGLVRWSRSQLEGFVQEKVDIDVNKLLIEVVELFKPSAADKLIQLKLQTEQFLQIHSDEEMIRIALRNMVSNAVKFSKPNSAISIQAFREEEMITVSVSNVGERLQPEVLNKLFSYQVTSSQGTSGEKGTGLGLAMASYFAKNNGGRIYAEPYDGTNSIVTFTIELPTKQNT